MPMTSTLALRATSTRTGTSPIATATSPLDYLARVVLTSGTGAGAADEHYYTQLTIAASGSQDLDLAGSLTGPLGGTLTFARIKGLIVVAAAGNTNNVNVSRPASNGVPLFAAAGDLIPVQPGGFFAWGTPSAAGIAVTAGTGDLITFANSGAGTSVTCDVIVIGASA